MVADSFWDTDKFIFSDDYDGCIQMSDARRAGSRIGATNEKGGDLFFGAFMRILAELASVPISIVRTILVRLRSTSDRSLVRLRGRHMHQRPSERGLSFGTVMGNSGALLANVSQRGGPGHAAGVNGSSLLRKRRADRTIADGQAWRQAPQRTA